MRYRRLAGQKADRGTGSHYIDCVAQLGRTGPTAEVPGDPWLISALDALSDWGK